MKLSRTFLYAVQAVAYIATQKDGVVVGRQAAKKLGVPEGFLLRIMVALSRGGILRSVKGPNGGYALRGKPNEVTLLDVFEAVEGPMRSYQGNLDGIGSAAFDRTLQKLADDVTESTRRHFSKIRVSDLAKAA